MNLSALDLTPKVLVEKSKSLSKELKLSIEVFDKTKLKKIGAGGILGVGQGSDRPPYLIKLKYKPRSKASKHIILIGKGITFDSGGLSIKPADGMEEMKHDMGGAAAVFGAMYAIGRVKPDCAVTAYIPAAENMTGGNAIHPGDVLKIVNGKTVEVLNTDAEGRLILADALSLAMREKPDYVIDLATLTGAAVVALGSHYAPIFSSSDELSNALISCGDLSGEHIWRLPLVEEYREYMKSSLADLRNTSTKREAGAITAALFLQEFVKADIPWAHIDIAGPAIFGSNIEHIPSGGTGFGARTIARFVFSVAKKVNKRK